MLFAEKNGGNLAHDVEQNKPDFERQILHVFLSYVVSTPKNK
jgi:hypothetical protein